MSQSFKYRTLLSAVAGLAAGAVWAAPTPFYAEDLDANGAFPANSLAAAKKTEFLATLKAGTAKTEDLQTASFDLDNLTASLLGLGTGAKLAAAADAGGVNPAGTFTFDTANGRFNTSPPPAEGCGEDGCKWWDAFGDFTITFAAATRAFGFYGTDFSDFSGALDLYLIDAAGGEVKVTVPTGSEAIAQTASTSQPVVPNEDAVNGSLIFFGVTDAARYFTAVRFDIQQVAGSTTADYFGFDDFVVGELNAREPGDPNPVPEPGSLALAGLALVGLAAAGRRRMAA